MELTPTLWMIDGPGQCYLYRHADAFTLIDTGVAGDAERILGYLADIGGKPDQLRQIIITHGHPDHTGGLAELIRLTDAQTYAHEADIPVISGEAGIVIPDVPEAERKAIQEAIANTPLAPPADVHVVLKDGDEIDIGGGARVIHVPGHTPGSIAIYLPDEKLLFTGDAAERDQNDRLILGMFNLDRPQAIASFQKLAELDFQMACLGHGRPEGRDGSRAFRRVASALAEQS